MSASNSIPRKKRSTLFIVISASIAIHLLAGGVLAVIKISEVLQKEPEFEAPAMETVKPPPPPPPPPPTPTRTQKSMPRPQPLAAQNPQNLDVPEIQIDRSNINMLSGRGFGGGLGQVGGGVLETMNLEFFGHSMEGDNVIFIIDISGSMIFPERGLDAYEKVADEVVAALQRMNGVRFNIIGFSKGADSFSPNFVRADFLSIERAKNWLKQMDPRNALKPGQTVARGTDFAAYKNGRHQGTRADLALKLAFKERPGLVIFLSDGEPTEKSSKEVIELAKELLQLNSVAINTISYKSKDGQKFLRELADISGGSFTALK